MIHAGVMKPDGSIVCKKIFISVGESSLDYEDDGKYFNLNFS